MPNKFQIDITARDKTAEGLKSVNDNFAKLTRGTPLERVTKGFAVIQEKAGALKGIAKSLFSMGDAATIAGGGIGEAAGGVGALGAAAGLAGVAVAGIGTGLGVATVAAYKFEENFTKAGAATGRMAAILGMSARQLQIFEGAGRRVGVSNEAMASSLQNMGNTMNDAVNGRNQTALALMTKLHIGVHKLKNGSIDAARGMMDLSDAFSSGNAQTKQMIAAQFGVGAAENFMLLSTRERIALQQDVVRSGVVMTDQQLKDSERFQGSVAAMDDHWHGLLNTLSQKLVIPWLQPFLDDLDRVFTGLDRLMSGKGELWVGSGPGDWGAVHVSGGGATGSGRGAVAGPSGPRAAQIIAFWKGRGMSDAGARGMLGGATAENNTLDPGRTNPISAGRSHAYGIGQWLGAGQREFARWAGHDIHGSTLQEQLEFQAYQLTRGSERRAGARIRAAEGDATAVKDRYLADYMRPGKGLRGDLARGDRALAANGLVHVDIHVKGAPAGTVALASAKGAGVTASARVQHTMAGAA